MGYKSILRSHFAQQRQQQRAQQKINNQQLREATRLRKKVNTAEEKLENIKNELSEIYAKGKITKEQYTELKKRENDISIDLVIVGKAAGVALAKRYITGKISKDEFEQLKKDLLPAQLLEERAIIQKEIDNKIVALKDFRTKCKDNGVNKCHKCSKEKSFFSPIKEVDGLKLCGSCKKELLKLQNYQGFTGNYFNSAPLQITYNDIDGNFKYHATINQNLL